MIPNPDETPGANTHRGEQVNATDHNASSAKARIFAALPSLLRAAGSGAPCARRSLALLATLLLALLPALGFSALAPASAAAEEDCAPFFGGNAVAGAAIKRTLTSIVLQGDVFNAREPLCEVNWKLEWSTSPTGPWQSFPGGSGVVHVEGAKPVPFETGELTGLEPETPYYERGTLEWEHGSQRTEKKEGTFETKSLGPLLVDGAYPRNSADIGETTLHVQGTFYPSPFETHWHLQYAPAEANGQAPAENSSSWITPPGGTGTITPLEAEKLQTANFAEAVHPEGDLGPLKPATKYYTRFIVEDEPEWKPGSGEKHHKEVTRVVGPFETHGPPAVEAFSTPALRLETLRAIGYVVPNGYDTHYHFEYGPTAAYGSTTKVEDAGSGGQNGSDVNIVSAELPGLQAGGTYHYRLVASSPAAGGVTVDGPDHTLTVPVPAASEPPACPNQALRTGLSAKLPACRAYEQLTPANKEGAEEPFGQINESGVLVGEEGERVMLSQPFTKWGSSQSPYFFSRSEAEQSEGGKGWKMTAGQVQPEAGIDRYDPELVSPDLTGFAFASGWVTATGVESPNVEFKVGAPGGPYHTVASVPRAEVGEPGQSGWVAASGDFSKLILKVGDRTLVPGHPSTSTSGEDLYEYANGALHQANVLSSGATIGSCGATMAKGVAETVAIGSTTSSRHAVSTDGSRVFFEAVPGSNCSEAKHLYMREAAADKTVDVGPYRFLAAKADGGEVLLESRSGGTQQVLLYETASANTRTLLSLHEQLAGGEQLQLFISEDFSTIYLEAIEQLTTEAPPGGGLYRYDIAAKALKFIAYVHTPTNEFDVTPDGRYAYWKGNVAGIPHRDIDPNTGGKGIQAIVYDSVQNVIECASCASALNPEPTMSVAAVHWGGSGLLESRDGVPQLSLISSDGSRLFFATPSALLLSDIDGEIAPKGGGPFQWTSPSSDVYEWRRNGVEGCAHVQGCLALVSSGEGGGLVMLLGASPSGRDVFFTTRQQLVPRDTDSAIDVYDARIGGGFPPPPPLPFQCTGGNCQNPLAAPIDTTPGSLSFSGPGNPPPPPAAKAKAKPKAKPCRKGTVRRKGRCVRKKGKARKAARRAAGRNRGGGR
jgi:hypothetical protein